MQNNEFNNEEFNKDFEFNDGMGDILKEKEQYAFSWGKTIAVALTGLVCVVFVTMGIINIGKKAFNSNAGNNIAVEAEPMESIIEEINDSEWEVLPSTTNESTAKSIKTPQAVKETPVTLTQSQPKEVAIQYEPAPATSQEIIQSTQLETAVPIVNNTQVSSKTVFRVIAGSFTKFVNAKEALTKLKKKGIDGYIWTSSNNGVPIYKIQVGAFSSYKNATDYSGKLTKKSIESYIVQN